MWILKSSNMLLETSLLASWHQVLKFRPQHIG